MFGSVPFQHYDFLVAVTDQLPNDGGSEHQASSEISLPADYFLNPQKYTSMAASLIPHEYIHVWNGLARRPADAAQQVSRPGRQWKSLADRDYDPVYLAGHRITWRDWEQREDYYAEGPLLWLGVDAQIRRLTDGKKSLNDFANSFFAASPAAPTIEPYTFPDLVAALNAVVPFSWQNYLLVRLNTHNATHLLDDLKSAGYSLVFNSAESAVYAQQERQDGEVDLWYSIGARIRQNGAVQSVSWDGPAFNAGMVPGMRVTKVDGEAFSVDLLRRRIQTASPAPIRLTVLNEEGAAEISVDDPDGLRFPHLEPR